MVDVEDSSDLDNNLLCGQDKDNCKVNLAFLLSLLVLSGILGFGVWIGVHGYMREKYE